LSNNTLGDQSALAWTKQQLLEGLKPFASILASSDPVKFTAAEKSYCQYYSINMHEQISGVEHVMGYFDAEGYRLAAHYFFNSNLTAMRTSTGYPNGTVFVVHGYFDHTGLYCHIIGFLLRSGFDVVIYDLPGHGLSSGESVAIEQFKQYAAIFEKCLKICRNHVKGPFFAVGQSTGAAILLEYLAGCKETKREFPFQHWVLLAPLVRPYGWRKLVLLHSLLGWLLTSWKRRFYANSHDPQFVQFLERIDPLQAGAISVKWVGALRTWVASIEAHAPLDAPVTIIQGLEDQTVDWRYNIPLLKQMLPLADIKLLAKGRHQLVNEIIEVREKVFRLMLRAFNEHDS